MRKAKKPKQKDPCLGVVMDLSDYPIMISRVVFEALLKEEPSARTDLIGLYMFYHSVRLKQHTTTVFATNSYVCKGLGWTVKRLNKRKRKLKELGLVTRITRLNQNGDIVGHYVRINNAWTWAQLGKLKRLAVAEGAICTRLRTDPSNAYINYNKIKLHSLTSQSEGSESKIGSARLREENKQYLPYARQLATIIQKSKKIKTTPDRMIRWASEIRKLHKSGVKRSRIKKALLWYAGHVLDEYVPVIESGSSLRSKFIKLENAMARDRGKVEDQEEQQPLLGIAS